LVNWNKGIDIGDRNNMSLDFMKWKESENIIPSVLEEKKQYYLDLMNIENSWTGRIDVLFSNNFFKETVQLIINAIVLFEKGYFDCAFYSLRQSLEISTTAVYFVDDTSENRKQEIRKWIKQDRFPMHKQMTDNLQKRQTVFADIREKMVLYFEEIEGTKQKLNKYVHKQGYDKFYIWHTTSENMENRKRKLIADFNEFLIKCIGAVAVYRLAIDPLPLLLADEDIYNRTGQLMTEGYSEDFIEKYIGINHIEAYKETDLYKTNYEILMTSEEMLPSVLNLVKNDYVDRTKIDEILSQRHLLSGHHMVALALMAYSENISRIYCFRGLHWFFSDTHSNRTKTAWSSQDFDRVKNGSKKYNVNYDEAFLSYLKVGDEDYYMEHNLEFTESEISDLEKLGVFLTNAFSNSLHDQNRQS
jgi:hypothetical protein